MKKKMKTYRIPIFSFLALLTFPGACSHPKRGEDRTLLQKDVKMSAQEREKANISLNTVLQPVNSSVISQIKAITPAYKKIGTTITGVGYLDFDTRAYTNIAARISGRIEKLYIKYAFQEIHAGQRIFDIYSPELVTAQQDLIFISKNSANDAPLISAAKQKLLLLGMTETQVKMILKNGRAIYTVPVYSPYGGHVHDIAHTQMATAAEQTSVYSANVPLSIKEGMYVTKGQNLFNVVNPHKLWALIKIDPSAVASLRLNQPVVITVPDLDGKAINGHINFIEPTLQSGDKRTTVRVYLDNMKHNLKVNSLLKATIQTGDISGLWLPRTALLDLGRRKVVFLKAGSIYRAHQVSTGSGSGDEIQVTKGLTLRDSVAPNAQYLSDSESFIKTQGK